MLLRRRSRRPGTAKAESAREQSFGALIRASAGAAAKELDTLRGTRYPDAVVDWVASQRAGLAEQISEGTLAETHRARWSPRYQTELLHAYQVERTAITDLAAAGSITPDQADGLRVTVDRLELNALLGDQAKVIAQTDSIIKSRTKKPKDG
jgi:hypothetical protein